MNGHDAWQGKLKVENKKVAFRARCQDAKDSERGQGPNIHHLSTWWKMKSFMWAWESGAKVMRFMKTFKLKAKKKRLNIENRCC